MQTLVVQTVYFSESDRAAATALGLELYEYLTRPRSDPLAFGPGIPIAIATTPEHVRPDAAQQLLVVPMLGAQAHGDEATRQRAVETIAHWHSRLGTGHVTPVFLSAAWRNEEDQLPGKAILSRLRGPGATRWLEIVVDVVLAACRLVSSGEVRPNIFVSHAKADLAGTRGLAEQIRDHAKTHTTGEAFFDTTDLEPGHSLSEQLDRAAGRGVFLAVRGDSYASRPWCERELLRAKRAGMPTLAVHVLRKGEQRSYPYSGNVPTVVWTPESGEEPTSVAHVFLRAIVEWLRARHFALAAEEYRSDLPSMVVLPRPPELLDLAQGPLLDKAPMVVMHPDPEVSLAEREVLREVRPRMRLVTPTTLYRGLELRTQHGARAAVHAPLFGREIALSLSDSPDADGAEGFTADHVKDATVFVARALISAGAAIAYGGDRRFGGFDELLAGLIVAYNGSGQSRAKYLISYLNATVDPETAGLQNDFAHTVRSLRSTEPYCQSARLPPPEAPSVVQTLAQLSDLRQVMAKYCFARVALGGQAVPKRDGGGSGYGGAYPGIVEEAWWTLQAAAPLYVIGGFGGAARLIADLLEGRTPPAMNPAAFAGAGYAEFRGRAAEFAADPGVAALGVPPTMSAMANALHAFGRKLLTSDAAIAWNGLSAAENRELFYSRDLTAITRLVMKGLYAKALASAEKKLTIELVRGSILQVERADAIALAAFANVPIGGAAAAIDQALSSRVTSALRDRTSVVQIPSQDVDADWLVIGDLGTLVAGDLSGLSTAIERCATSISVVARRHGFARIAIVTFGTSAHGNLAEAVAAMLRGFAPLGGNCTLQWFETDLLTFDALKGILVAKPTVELSFRELPPGPAVIATHARDVLITTRFAGDMLHVTVLPPEGAAAALAVNTELTGATLQALSRSSATSAPPEILGDSMGQEVARALLGPVGSTLLGRLTQHRLVVQHDVATAGLPFETLSVDGHRFALGKGIVRRPALSDLPSQTPRPQRAGALNVALVINPTEDLPGAETEGTQVLAQANQAGIRIHGPLQHRDATRAAIIEALRDPNIDVFHFCGHAFYEGPAPDQSGLRCANGERLTGADIAEFDATPRVAFFNACRSARVREIEVPVHGAVVSAPEFTRAFAAYFLRGGIEAYLGTLWPVSDDAGARFAAAVYRSLATGASLDAAVLAARVELRDRQQADWANYILYGDGSFSITR
jgi:CHAT domain-containing protein